VRLFPAFCALFLTGCGLTSSPADGLTFTAPYGWQASPGIMGYMQYWHPASRRDEMLVLIRSPFKQLDLSHAPNRIDLGNSTSRTHFDSWDRVEICGNQPAIYVIGESYRDTKSGEVERHMRMVMTNLSGATYIALYAYPLTGLPNGEALASLRQLCLKR
jgi:hypothetical protein